MKKSILITLLAFIALFSQAQTNRYLKMSDTLTTTPPTIVTKSYLEKNTIKSSPLSPQNADISISGKAYIGGQLNVINNATLAGTYNLFGGFEVNERSVFNNGLRLQGNWDFTTANNGGGVLISNNNGAATGGLFVMADNFIYDKYGVKYLKEGSTAYVQSDRITPQLNTGILIDGGIVTTGGDIVGQNVTAHGNVSASGTAYVRKVVAAEFSDFPNGLRFGTGGADLTASEDYSSFTISNSAGASTISYNFSPTNIIKRDGSKVMWQGEDIVIKSSNGVRWKLVVSDTGELATEQL